MEKLRVVSYLSRRVRPLYEVAAKLIGEAVGLDTTFDSSPGYESYVAGDADVAFICSLPYVTFEEQGRGDGEPIAAPVLRGARYGGRPIYFSDVIVRHDAPHASFEDLRGTRWAFNEPLSQSGYGITRNQLLTMGETAGFFGEVVNMGSHAASMDAIVAGTADGAAIDSQVLAIALRDRPELASRLRVVDYLGPSPIQPVTVSKRLGPDLRRQIAQVLERLHEDARATSALSGALVTRFVPIGAADYEPVRAMLAASRDAGFLDIR